MRKLCLTAYAHISQSTRLIVGLERVIMLLYQGRQFPARLLLLAVCLSRQTFGERNPYQRHVANFLILFGHLFYRFMEIVQMALAGFLHDLCYVVLAALESEQSFFLTLELFDDHSLLR